MRYMPMGLRGRAFMVNPAFAEEFGIPQNDEMVVKTPRECLARMKLLEKEMRREQELREIVKRNHSIAFAFSFILRWRLPDKEKLLRLKRLAKDKKREIKLPPNLSLASYVSEVATKNSLSLTKKLKKVAELVNAMLSAHKRFQSIR